MATKRLKRFNLVSILSVATLLIIGVTTLIISGNFSGIVTPFAPLLKPFAALVQPKLTEGFTDAFKADTINEDKWTIGKLGDVVITQTAANNLRMDVPAGSQDNKAKRASLTFKELLEDKGDFRIIAVVYRPVVTGEGTGITGLQFASAGAGDDEGAVVQWLVNGSTSKVTFVVRGPDGTRLESEQEDLVSTVAVFRLDRVNRQYRAYYKVGNELSADTGWKELGVRGNPTLGNEGRVILFTNNGGRAEKFPKVAGRFDQTNIRWEGAPATQIGFSDAFANGNIGNKWLIGKTDGAQIYEHVKDNLIMSLPSGALGNNPRRATITRNDPIVPEGKDFVFNASVFKPNVVGEGTGHVALRFVSAGNVDDEGAAVRWVVGDGASRLVLIVRNPDGSLAEGASLALDAKVNKLTLRLVRSGNKYSAFYRIGDLDADFVSIGAKESSVFGAKGKVGLAVSNQGAAGKYPRVVARIDQVHGSISK